MHDLGVATYMEVDAYPATPTRPVVTFGKLPTAPDLAVALNHYNTDPNFFERATPLMFVQLRWRAPTLLGVNDLVDDANTALTTYTPASWPGGVNTLWIVRATSSVPPAVEDETGRWERPDNYEIRLTPGG